MSVQAIVCTGCGASLMPRVLETRVKCTYCEAVYTIVRDSDGITGLTADGKPAVAAGGPAGASAPVGAGASAGPGGPMNPMNPAGLAGALGALGAGGTGIPNDTMKRLEQDAELAVRGIVAAERMVEAASGRPGARGCLVFLVAALLGLVLCRIA